MKTKKLIAIVFAFIGLSTLTNNKVFGQVSITANSFSPKNQICFTSETIQVLDLTIENLYTSSGDSVYIDELSLGSWAHPYTLADSIFAYIGSVQIAIGKFSSSRLNLKIKQSILASSKINVVIYCKTLTVSQQTNMTIDLGTVTYIHNSWTNSVWPNVQSPWFGTYDCTMPILTDNKSFNRNTTCLDNFGDTIMMMGFTIKNPNKDSISIDGFRIFGEENQNWIAQIDSFLIYQNGVVIAAKGLFNSFSNLYFNKIIPGLSSMDFYIACKMSSFGQLGTVEIDSIFWTLTGKQKASDTWLGSWGGYLQNCKPSVSLSYYLSTKSDKLCTGDHISMYPEVGNTVFPIKKYEYFVNENLYRVFYDQTNKDIYMPLVAPVTKIVVKITDTSGRTASDSIILNVGQSPIPKMTASSTSMCSGSYVTLIGDTTGLSKWAWDWETASNTVRTKKDVFYGGNHNFFVFANNGCVADTSVNIYEVPAQSKPSITISDWVLGSSVKADSFVWSKYNDSLKEWIVIQNSNQQFINRTDKGYFIVKAFNTGGCSAESEHVAHNGYTALDSLPHVKLMISASKPGNEFCSSEKLTATRKILETVYPIVKEEWFLNGSKIPFSKNQLFDGMQYLIPTSTETVKLKVVITDKIGKMAMDSVILKIHENPKAKVSASSHSMCAGDSVIILADTTSLYKWAWNDNKPSTSINKLVVSESGNYKFTATSSEGCTADTTVVVTKLPAQAKPVGLSNDWTIGSSVKADSFLWEKYSDSLKTWLSLENSNKMFITQMDKGYYMVTAFNGHGCSSISDAFYHKGWVIQDSLPHVKLLISASKPGKEFCSDEKVVATRKTFETSIPIIKEEWFLNAVKIPFMKSQMFDGMTYNVPMTTETVKLKVVVTDSMGKMASDSVELTVYKNPKASITLSLNKFCSDESVIITADTTSLYKWAWGSDKPNNSYTNKLKVSESGSYKFTATSSEGCSADTTVTVEKLPVPNKPTGLSNDWTIGSSIDADSFIWYKLDDITNSFRVVENSNKMFLRELRKGYYFVEVLSTNGCSNISDAFYHKGYEIKDSLPHVKLLITASKPGTKFCADEKIVATRKVLEPVHSVIKEEWFLNGNKLPFSKSQLFDGMQYNVPMMTETVKVKVVITDSVGKMASDSFEITVYKKPKTSVVLSADKFCSGTDITIIADTTNLSKWAWNDNTSSRSTNKLVVSESGSYKFTATSSEGCTADTTVVVTKLPAQAKPVGLSNDWTICSYIKADSFVWYRYNDTTNNLEVIKNYNKMFVTELRKGYYAVEAFNYYGCSSLSDVFHHDGWVIQDSLPHVKLLISASKPGTKFCSDEKIVATRKILETAFTVVKEEWFLNESKIPFTKGQMFDGMQYQIPMITGNVKLKVIVTDAIGKQASDSFELTVLPKPRIGLGHLKTDLCYRTSLELALDTSLGIDKWAWNGVFSKNPINKILVTENSVQSLIVYSKDGCISDTSIQITMLPVQERLKISSYDTMMWANQMAYRIVWLYGGFNIVDTDKQIITSKKTGFYQVKAMNEYGCESFSDLYRFDYTAPKDPETPVDNSSVKTTTNDKVVDGNVCPGEFHPQLSLINLNQNSITKARWFVNGLLVYTYDANCVCKLYPESVWIEFGSTQIVVIVNLANGKTKTDTMNLNVVSVVKPVLDYQKQESYCSYNTINFRVQNTQSFVSIYWPSENKTGGTLPVKGPNGQYFARTMDLNGCVAYSDTVEITSVELPKPDLEKDGCELFASVDFNQKGIWLWHVGDTFRQTTVSPNYTADNKGWYKVKFSYNGCVSEASNAQFINCELASADNVKTQTGFSLYPNPATDQFTIESSLGKDEARLTDMQGRMLRTITIENGVNIILRDGLPAGMYLLHFASGATQKFVFK